MIRSSFIVEVEQTVPCPRCGARAGEQCDVPAVGARMHLARWNYADAQNHDPGDEDRQ